MIQISTINASTVISDADVQKIMVALNTQWNRDLVPTWNLDAAAMTFIPKGQTPPVNTWWLVFLDDSDQAGALAYHDVTNEGLPISKVFAKTLLSDHASISVGASHEVCEMAVDPTINLSAQDGNGVFWAYEVCDPVESDEYGYKIGDVLVSDFITPAWYGFAHSAGMSLDFTKKATAPFAVLSGGYAQKFDSSNGWQQVTGDKARKSGMVHVAAAPEGSRRERRTRGAASFALSAHQF